MTHMNGFMLTKDPAPNCENKSGLEENERENLLKESSSSPQLVGRRLHDANIYIHTYIYIYVYIHMCVYAYIYVYIHICMYTHASIHD